MLVLQALKILANLKKLDLNWNGTFDGDVAQVDSLQFTLGNVAKVVVKFSLDGEKHTLQAAYFIRGSGEDRILFDGGDVSDDDVDFDLITKVGLPPYVVLQFEFRFTDADGAPHEFVARARRNLPLPL